MKLSIFIRAYRNDARWLFYSLQSIKKFVQHDELVIACPKKDAEIIRPLLNDYPHKFIETREICEGYLAQQIDKLHAHEWCSNDLIMITDCDAIFTHPITINTFMVGDKPLLLRTRYSSMTGDVLNWQGITEKAIGFKSDWEYMRRLPFIYWRETLSQIKNAFPLLPLYIAKQKNRSFSEFNFVGQFIEKWQSDKYEIVDTEDFLPPSIVKQFWSYSGMTEQEENEIKEMLK